LLPGIVYTVVSRIWSVAGALFIVGFLGIIGIIILIFYPDLFFCKRKYQIILGFNKK